MDTIAKNVFVEDQFPGVTLGVISQSRGLIQIDAPPAPEDGRSWRASMMGMGEGHERVLVNLDSHPDRTLGVRAMDCTVIAHEKTALAFQNRPNTFKAQGDETGANWEGIPGLGSVRWAPPEISFAQQMTLHWSDTPVILESHPGPTSGAIWVILPDEKIVFVGDAVAKGRPPFLAHADIPAWLEALELLQSADYKGYTVVSGRGGRCLRKPYAVRSIRSNGSMIRSKNWERNVPLQQLLRNLPTSSSRITKLLLRGINNICIACDTVCRIITFVIINLPHVTPWMSSEHPASF